MLAASDTLDTRVQIFAIVGSALLFVFVLELLRRRRLCEPYAILWLLASVVLLVLSVWDDLLDSLAELVGIATPANALFVVGFGFVLVLLLSFSTVDLAPDAREQAAGAGGRAPQPRARRATPKPRLSRRRERQESPIP